MEYFDILPQNVISWRRVEDTMCVSSYSTLLVDVMVFPAGDKVEEIAYKYYLQLCSNSEDYYVLIK